MKNNIIFTNTFHNAVLDKPLPASNGEFQIYSTAESGLVMAGRGSSFDMVITNKNGADTIS